MGTHVIKTKIIMDNKNYHRYIKMHGDPPKCRNCDKELVVGTLYVRNKHNINSKIYCVKCAMEKYII
jgi:hypothetical protein